MSLSIRALVAPCLVLSLTAACKKEVAAPAAPVPAAVVPAAVAPPAVKDRVEVAVTAEGFVPARIPAKAGQPLTLVITRKTEKTCATEIVFAGEDRKTDLPLDKPIEVTYTPKATGDVKFGCGMGMMVAGVIAVSE